jgi:hypothetical protein
VRSENPKQKSTHGRREEKEVQKHKKNNNRKESNK